MDVESEQLERIKTATEDLVYLREEWDEEVDDSSLRRSSVILRRLLVEGEMGRAWRDLGLAKQPIVTAPSLEVWLRGVPGEQVSWAHAGGARYRGMEVSGALERRGAASAADLQRRHDAIGGDVERQFSLSRFVESPCVVVRGQFISRREVIKYVANKLGGVHPVDSKRNVERAADRQYQLLDSVRSSGLIAGKNAVYFELLAIGQCLTRSPDIESFLDRSRLCLSR